jgi:hypothetical protein
MYKFWHIWKLKSRKKHFILFSNDEFVKQILKKKSNLT